MSKSKVASIKTEGGGAEVASIKTEGGGAEVASIKTEGGGADPNLLIQIIFMTK